MKYLPVLFVVVQWVQAGVITDKPDALPPLQIPCELHYLDGDDPNYPVVVYSWLGHLSKVSWSYTWDTEDRLVRLTNNTMTTSLGLPDNDNGDRLTLGLTTEKPIYSQYPYAVFIPDDYSLNDITDWFLKTCVPPKLK